MQTDFQKLSQQRWQDQRNRKVEHRGRALSAGVQDWLTRYAQRSLREIRSELRRGGLNGLKRKYVSKRLPIEKVLSQSEYEDRILFAKVDPRDFDRIETELYELMRKYGLVQLNEGAKDASGSVGHTWIMPKRIAADWNQKIANKVVLLVDETESAVRESIRQLVSDALLEDPQPSAAELGRRIARQWMGPGQRERALRGDPLEDKYTANWRRSQEEIDAGGREHIFSYARAATIARTELAQADNAGIAEGYKDAGVEKVRWKAVRNDGRSKGRMHYKMNQHPPITVKAMKGSNRSKWFKLPSGDRAPYPNWIGLKARETVNCRCVLLPAL